MICTCIIAYSRTFFGSTFITTSFDVRSFGPIVIWIESESSGKACRSMSLWIAPRYRAPHTTRPSSTPWYGGGYTDHKVSRVALLFTSTPGFQQHFSSVSDDS